MKNRMVNTEFWNDNYTSNLSPTEKLLFLYFLTNTHTTLCGVYQIPLKTIINDTGIDKDNVLVILERFEIDKKMVYREGWIAIKNFIKNQNQKSPAIQKGIQDQLECVPVSLKKWIFGEIKGIDTLPEGLDTVPHSNTNPNPNSNTNSNTNTNGDETGITVSEDCVSVSDFSRIFESKGEAIRTPAHEAQIPGEWFCTFWNEYPRQIQKEKAATAFSTCLKNKDSPEEIITAASNYRAYCEENGITERYVKYPENFLGSWRDFLTRESMDAFVRRTIREKNNGK